MTHRTKQGTVVPNARTHNMAGYRFWFDGHAQRWFVCYAKHRPGTPHVVSARSLELIETDVVGHPDGTSTCTAELIVNGATLKLAEHGGGGVMCEKIILRMLREYKQVVHVPLIRSGAAVPAPG